MSSEAGARLGALDALEKYRESFLEAFLTHWKGYEQLAVIEMVRAVDLWTYVSEFSKEQGPGRDSAWMRAHLMRLGLTHALKAFLPTLKQMGDGIPWRRSDTEASASIEQALLTLGELAHLRRFAALEKYGLAQGTLITDRHIRIEAQEDEAEAHDRTDLAWFWSTRDPARQSRVEAANARLEWALAKIDAYVEPDERYFIRYDSDEEVLAYYQGIAKTWADDRIEQEALPHEVVVGGRPFARWRTCGSMALARVLQHVSMATRLSGRNPGLNLRDFITVYVRKEDLADVWAEQLGEQTSRQTKAVVECASLDGERAGEYDRDHEMALPLHIEFGNHFYLLPLFGALLNPYFHMVNEIKRRYRKDWDRVVALRESRFRGDIRAYFADERFYVAPTGVGLRTAENNALTDIDAVVCDRKTGDIALMQLKWNDVYARSLRERESRRRNILQANAWVQKVSGWVNVLSKPRLEGWACLS